MMMIVNQSSNSLTNKSKIPEVTLTVRNAQTFYIMWVYIIISVSVVVIGILVYIFYRGYSKVKPKPIVGIPCPPFTHSILGHPDKMMHPLKHELRLEVTEAARSPVHQVQFLFTISSFAFD